MTSIPETSVFTSLMDDIPDIIKSYLELLQGIKFTPASNVCDAITGVYFIFTGFYFTFYGHRSFQDFMTWAALMLGFWLTPIFYEYVIENYIKDSGVERSIESLLTIDSISGYVKYLGLSTEMIIQTSIRFFLFFITFAGWYGSRLQGKKNQRRNATSCSIAFGAISSRLICMISDKNGGYNDYKADYITNYCISMMGGIVFETAVLFTWRPLVIIAFGIFGYVSGMYIEAMLKLFTTAPMYSYIFCALFALLFCLLSHLLKTVGHTLISALLGSYVTVFGVNYFVKNGLFHTFISDHFIKIFLGKPGSDNEDLIKISWIMLILILALGIFGIILQTMEIIDSKAKKEIERLESEESRYTQKPKKKGPVLTVKRRSSSVRSSNAPVGEYVDPHAHDDVDLDDEIEDLEDPHGKDRVQFYE